MCPTIHIFSFSSIFKIVNNLEKKNLTIKLTIKGYKRYRRFFK